MAIPINESGRKDPGYWNVKGLSKRGKGSASVQEAYELSGNNYYNPNWGYQNGEKRNARMSNFHKPMLILSHYWTIDEI